MIRTLAVGAALAGAVLFAPVAQAQPDSGTGPVHPYSVSNGAALSRGPAITRPGKRFVPTVRATPFGSPGSFSAQPGLAVANENGNRVVSTATPLGSATPMVRGNLVGPATETTPVDGGIRTRHGRTGSTSLFGVLRGLFG